MSPASGDNKHHGRYLQRNPTRVSIQLMSPASGDLTTPPNPRLSRVSIQLMSPASGDHRYERECHFRFGKSFHSINVPSEWGLYNFNLYARKNFGFHSINVPSEWGQSLQSELENALASQFPFN